MSNESAYGPKHIKEIGCYHNNQSISQSLLLGKEQSPYSYIKNTFKKINHFKPMGFHSGTLINGEPVVCGGTNENVNCFQYQRERKNWIKVNL